MTPHAAAEQHNAANALEPGDADYLVAPIPVQTPPADVPRVWIGCLFHYNAGAPVGEWFDAIDADRVGVADVHRSGPPVTSDCQELWCMDSANIPTDDEMSPAHAAVWGKALARFPDEKRQAFCAWLRGGDYVVGKDSVSNVDSFDEHFCGWWPSFADFSYGVAQSSLLRDVSAELALYFNHAAYASDLEVRYTTVDAPDGGVFVFRNP
ncbi:antirestriction protein ArdA [Rhodococcus sp. NCIMB 12038]|uniref:antirestriction protein ArdA n=1 Tax=Rhodococcus sp. NCIMB 12038 TaxID=933800 RepID=UPI0015C62B88|nr:antirestriction protein ArdA [Rhodococcus sp. NCIMB 12038]